MRKTFYIGPVVRSVSGTLTSMSLYKIVPFLILLLLAFEQAYANEHFSNLRLSEIKKLGSRSISDEHPLYQKILNEFESTYQDIGRRQAENALSKGGASVSGGLNKIGIRYAKDFVDFKVNVERQLAPDLFDDKRWIVRDVFSVEISASKLISGLSDSGAIEVGESSAALFAGLKFKRVFTWVHFAPSYVDGLTKNFHKLFLPFLDFNKKAYLNLPKQEIIKKEDFLTFSAGAIGSLAVAGPLWLSVGALSSYKKIAMVQFQAVSEEERIREGEVLRMQLEKTKGVEVGVRASVQMDFLKLLKITLLSYDFSYSYEHKYKMHLSFTKEDLEKIHEDEQFKLQMKNALRYGEVDQKLFANMLLAVEESKEANLKSRYMIFLIGGMKEQATTLIEVTKKGVINSFFRHNYEKSFFIQNFWGRVLGAVFKSLLGGDSLINKSLVDYKKLEIEYRSSYNLIEKKAYYNVEEDSFSLIFERSFRSSKLTKFTQKYAVNILETYAGVDPLIWELLRKKELKGPMTMRGKYVIKKAGLEFFTRKSYRQVYADIKKICNGFFCRKKLAKKFDTYWKSLSHKSYTKKLYKKCKPRFKLFRSARKKRYLWESCLQKRTKITFEEQMQGVPLWKLKGFVQVLIDKTNSKIDLYNFFGVENVFLHGSFRAVNLNDQEFISYFKEGKFSGLGVVDNYLRGNGLRGVSEKK